MNRNQANSNDLTQSAGKTWRQDDLDNFRATIIQNVSHELRTPLSVVMGYAGLLHDGDFGTLTAEQQQALSRIVKHTDNLRELVNQIGMLMEVESGQGSLERLELADFTTEIVETSRLAAQQAGVTLEAFPDADIQPIFGDKRQLQQAVHSLLDNAIKFTPKGGAVQVKVHNDSSWVCIEISDSGIGVADDLHEQIFTLFYQADGSPTRQYGGVGLGLTLAHAIAIKHKGHIELKSQPNQGSRFTLRLPYAGAAAANELPIQRIEPRKQYVLIVDDDPSVSFVLEESLQTLPNCEILVANSSERALQMIAKQPFDLVLSDYKMPKMDGIELTKAIHALSPATLIIWMTGYSDQVFKAASEQLAIYRYLMKPLEIDEIRRVSQNALDTILVQE